MSVPIGRATVLAPASLALLSGLVAACGSSSTPSTTPSSTPLQPLTSPTPTTGPVLDVTQYGFRMTFSPALGTINYLIDSSGSGPTTDSNNVKATYIGKVTLFTSAFAAACSATGSSTSTAASSSTSSTSSSTTTSSTTTPATLSPAAAPAQGGTAPPVEGTITAYSATAATSLRFQGGPTDWVRAGQYLLGFLPPQSVPCGLTVYSRDAPLLLQMFNTATAD